VDFKNTIIILTSNLGSNYILEGIDSQGEISDEAKSAVNNLLKHQFRPEFLNRLDEIVFYKPLKKSEISAILDLLFKDLNMRLRDKQLTVSVTERAKDYIVEAGYDPVYGARPLKRFVQSSVETLIARLIISEDLEPDTNLEVDYDGRQLVINH